MKHIAVLIDFTDLCHTSAKFAASIAKRTNSKITLVHVASPKRSSESSEIDKLFDPYLPHFEGLGVSINKIIHFGNFNADVPGLMRFNEVDLVVVGTHGIQDVKQYLFGSNILKLTQSLTVPALVVQEDSAQPEEASRMLFPMASHTDFIRKIETSHAFSTVYDNPIVIYRINKEGSLREEELDTNLELAQSRFTALGANFVYVTEPTTVFSYGYAAQVIKYATDNNFGFISIMTQPSSNQVLLANADKERILLNEANIPVLCINGST